MLGWQVAAGLDWACLWHAYGPARDTPDHLRALAGEDFEAQRGALDHLAFSVVHQYSVYPVTPFVVRVVEASLSVPRRAAVATTSGRSWRTSSTSSMKSRSAPELPGLAHDTLAQQDSSSLDRLWEWSMADLHDALAELVDVIVPLTDDHDQGIRVRSICLLARLGAVSTAAPRA